MPQFVILAYDGADAGAAERRMKARAAHLRAMAEAQAKGAALCGAALLDGNGKMIGSLIVTHFESRAELDAWLAAEPYVAQNVWEKIEVIPASLGPSFQGLLKGQR